MITSRTEAMQLSAQAAEAREIRDQNLQRRGLLRTTDAARLLNKSRRTVQRMAKTGQLPCVQGVGHFLFRRADVERLRDELEKAKTA